MWQYNYTNELYHYGVPGMKWGVRRGGIRDTTPEKKPRFTLEENPDRRSERQKKYEDDYGINPHRPNGTKPQVGRGIKTGTSKKEARQAAKQSEEYKSRKRDRIDTALTVGGSVCAGILSAGLGGKLVANIKGSNDAAVGTAMLLSGWLGSMSYASFMKRR